MQGAGQTSWLEAESVKLWSAQLVKRKWSALIKTMQVKDELHLLAEHLALSSPYWPWGNIEMNQVFVPNEVKC